MTPESNPTQPLIIERTFQAPVALVWKAITETDAISDWAFELKEFKPEVGFAFGFVAGKEGHVYDHRCVVTEVIPQKKLSYSWRYHGHEGDSVVTFELFAEGNQTRLKLTHDGIETFANHPAPLRENLTKGWTYLVGESLQEYLEKSRRRLVVGREFAAPRELVWKAWTDPRQVKEWLSLSEESTIESVAMDMRVGGKFRIQTQRTADGEYFTAAGTYLEVTPPERLVYTWDWEKDGGGTEYGELEGKQTQLTVEFRAIGNRTQLLLTHENFATVESRDAHEGGWTGWLGRLARFIEPESTSGAE